MGAGGVWWGGHAPRALNTHLATRHRPLQQVRESIVIKAVCPVVRLSIHLFYSSTHGHRPLQQVRESNIVIKAVCLVVRLSIRLSCTTLSILIFKAMCEQSITIGSQAKRYQTDGAIV